MNIAKLAGVTLIGAGIWWFLRKAGTARATTFSLRSVGVNIKKMLINLTLAASNPTGGRIQIEAINGELYFNGSAFANVQQFTPQTINPSGVSLVKLELRPNLVGAWQAVKSLIQGKQSMAGKLRFVGTARVQGLNIPIDSVLA